jgi:hypothetical protein
MFSTLGELLILAVLVGVLLFWCYQFIQLMLLADADFPDRFDKILWFLAFFLAFFITPFVFRFWKQAYLAVRRAEVHQSRTQV